MEAGTPTAGADGDRSLAPERRAVKEDDAAATAAAAGVPAETEVEPERVHLHMPVDVRNVALAVIAVLLSLYMLHWAKAVVVPVLLGVMFSYALSPAIDRLEHWRVPRAASAGLLLTAILVGLGTAGWAVSDDADALIETLPEVAQKLRKAIQKPGEKTSPSTLEKVQQAATEIERATQEAALPTTASAVASGAVPAASAARPRRPAAAPGSSASVQVEPMPTTVPPTPPGVTRVVVEKPRIDIKDYLWEGTLGLITLAGQATLVVFITFFLLASGNTFRRKMVKLAGPRLSQKKITVQALDEVHEQMQRYLFVQMATSVVVGVLSGLAFYALGLNQSLVWGILAGITNLVPYLGAVVIGLASTAIGIVQFESIDRGLYIGAASFAIHTLVGNLLTPWWMGRASRMSAFAVFVGVLLFGWLWGIWGLLLGMPILMVVKSVCDRVEELKPVGELLGA
jgi:predicted PurR-regulated permease PerM